MWSILGRILVILGLAGLLTAGIAVEKGKPKPQESESAFFSCGSCAPPPCEYPPCPPSGMNRSE